MVNLFRTSRQIILASQSPRRQRFLKDLGIEYLLCHDLRLSEEKHTGDASAFVETDSGAVAVFGVRAKDDTEERPRSLELPGNYVLRIALGKVMDAMRNTGFQISGIADGVGSTDAVDFSDSVDFSGFFSSTTTLDLSYMVKKHILNSSGLHHSINPLTKLHKNRIATPIFITADTIVALDDEILGKPQDEADALDMLSRMVGREHRVLTAVCVADLKTNCVYSFTDIAHVHFAPWSTEILESYIKTGDPMDKAGSYGIQGVGMFLSDGISGSWDTVAGLPMAKLLELLLHCEAIHIASV